MSRFFLAVAAAAAAALLTGCGGGDDAASDSNVILLTDRPAIAAPLASEIGGTVHAQAVPPASAAAAVSLWAALGVQTVVAHYVDLAPTPMVAWRTSYDICAEAKKLGMGCVITTSATDWIDHATGKRSAATATLATYCSLDTLTGAAAARALARCVRIERGAL
jgi:hypothetical protein